MPDEQPKHSNIPDEATANAKSAARKLLERAGLHGGPAIGILFFLFQYVLPVMQEIRADLSKLETTIKSDARQDTDIEDLKTRLAATEQQVKGLRRTTGALWEVNRSTRNHVSDNTVTGRTNEKLIEHMFKIDPSKQPVSKERTGGVGAKLKDFWNGKKKKMGTAKLPRKLNTDDLKRHAENQYMQQQVPNMATPRK